MPPYAINRRGEGRKTLSYSKNRITVNLFYLINLLNVKFYEQLIPEGMLIVLFKLLIVELT